MRPRATSGLQGLLVDPSNAARLPYMLFGLALVARLVAWPHSDVVDADAVTRALLGESYMHYPGWRGDGVWPPLHFYLSGLFTVLCGSREIGSVLVNILLGSAIAFPIFALVRQWSTTAVATAVVLVVVFNPLLFRNSLQGLSEIPFFFLTACAFNSTSVAISDASARGTRHALIAGLFLTIASGMRYEAWILIGLLAFLIIATKPRLVLLFLLPASIFPVTWMVTDHLAHGNMFRGIEHLVHWKNDAPVVATPDRELWMHTLFFPVSTLLALSPIAVLMGLLGTGRMLFRGTVPKQQWMWLLLFPVLLAIMMYKARHAELLTQHRFTMTLILLFIPYLVLGFAALRSNTIILLGAFVITVGSIASTRRGSDHALLSMGHPGSPTEYALTFMRDYTLRELEPMPVLDSPLPDRIVKVINANSRAKRLLVLDFFGWQETYNVAFRANIISTSIVFLPEQKQQGLDKLDDYLSRISGFDGILVLAKDAAYQKALSLPSDGPITLVLPTRQLRLFPLAEIDNIVMYLFETTERAPHE